MLLVKTPGKRRNVWRSSWLKIIGVTSLPVTVYTLCGRYIASSLVTTPSCLIIENLPRKKVKHFEYNSIKLNVGTAEKCQLVAGDCHVMSRIIARLVFNSRIGHSEVFPSHDSGDNPTVSYTFHSLITRVNDRTQYSALRLNYLIWWVVSPFENRNFTQIKHWTYIKSPSTSLFI